MSRSHLRRARLALGLAAAAATLACASLARATTITDPPGDFIATYTGPTNGNLDLLSVSAVQDGTDVTLSAVLNGAVGTTSGSAYVWGVNRGAGTQGLLAGSPSVGAGVFFDAVILLSGAGTGRVVDINASGPPTSINLDPSAITISGDTITAVAPFADLPSRGLTTAAYGYNLWSRSGLTNNAQIADFAPNASDFFASAPEPATWGLMILGFGAAGAQLRRRRLQSISLRCR